MQNKINGLTMGQLVNVLLGIDKAHTILQKYQDCRQGFGEEHD